MTLLIGTTKDTMEITDPNDGMIHTDITKVFMETDHDQLIAFRYTIHVIEALVDTGTNHAIILAARAPKWL